jgi:hypothetical protein
VKDTATRTWHGWIEPASGDAKVLGLDGYHFSNEDVVTVSDSGAVEFSFTTRAWTPNVQQVDLSPILPGPRAVFPNGVYAIVSGGPGARFHVLGAGNFTFALGDLDGGRLLSFDNGNIEVELVAEPFAASAAGEADFPSLAMGPAGRAAMVWQEFLGERDRLASRVMYFVRRRLTTARARCTSSGPRRWTGIGIYTNGVRPLRHGVPSSG